MISTTSTHLHPTNNQQVKISKTRTIDTKQELKTAIINCNQQHFAQAQGTPFTQPPLFFINSTSGFNVYRNAKDNKNSLPDDAFVETNTVLDILEEGSNSAQTSWSLMLPFDEFISGILHWHKTTSTSPSSCHLGIYKALVTAYINASGEFSNKNSEDNK